MIVNYLNIYLHGIILILILFYEWRLEMLKICIQSGVSDSHILLEPCTESESTTTGFTIIGTSIGLSPQSKKKGR